MHRAVIRLLWRVLAGTAVLLGLIGVFVPGLPTVPFLLLATWAAGRGTLVPCLSHRPHV